MFISVDMKGQRVAHIPQVACFQSALKIHRFICPKIFFGRCLVEVIVLSRSIVSLCKAMYQSGFVSLEFSLNWVVGNDVSIFQQELPEKSRFWR